MSEAERIEKALLYAYLYGNIDGAHHKAWVIDQMVRALTGCQTTNAIQVANDEYKQWVKNARAGQDGAETYNWDEGIAP